MAKLLSALELSGKIGGLSFYRLTGSDQVIVRRKGGPTKTQVRNSPKMAVTRLRNAEFSGRAIAAGKIMQAMAPLKSIADYSLAGALNKLLFAVQEKDVEHALGCRSVCTSSAGYLLEGFNLNRKSSWEDMIPAPLQVLFTAETGIITVSIPQLIPGLTFNTSQGSFPLFRLVLTAGLVADLHNGGTGYLPQGNGPYPSLKVSQTGWFPVPGGCGAQTLAIDSGFTIATAIRSEALIIGIGLCFGIPAPGGQVQTVKHFGAGKLLAVK